MRISNATKTVAAILLLIVSCAILSPIIGQEAAFKGVKRTYKDLKKDYGAVGDGVTDDRAAFASFTTDANAGNASVLFIPAGTYSVGQVSNTNCINITVSNIEIYGAGKGVSTILYSSAGALGGDTNQQNNGSPFRFPTLDSTGYHIHGLTFQDTNTSAVDLNFGIHAPSALDIYRASKVLIEGVEFIDVKGNAALTNGGDANSGDIVVRDCVFRGTAGANYIERDPINIGWGNHVVIANNHFSGYKTHGIEGGGSNMYWKVIGNTFDHAQSTGGNILGSFSFIDSEIVGNTFLNIPNGRYGIALAPTASAAEHKNITIANNVFDSATGTAINIVKKTGGNGPLGLIVTGNVIVAAIAFECNVTVGAVDVSNNFFDQGSGTTAIFNSFGAMAIATGYTMRVTNNSLKRVSASSKWFNWASGGAGLKTYGVIASGNRIGTSASDNATADIFGNAADTADITSIAAGGVSADRTVTLNGALAGDRVYAWTDDTLENGLFIQAQITAGDTITWKLVNPSTSSVDPGSHTYRFSISRN